MNEVSCWKCKHFERVRMSAFCHGGKRVKKLPQKCWYSGEVKFCTDFKLKKQEHEMKSAEGSDDDDAAIEALSADRWIPFSEKLPEEWQQIIFTEVCRVAKRKPYVGIGQFMGIEEWNFYLTNSVKEKEKNHLWGRDKVSVTGRNWHMEESEIIAWIPMPPPYEDSHADDWILEHD